MSDYDVIVIGSGAGGGTLVHRLAPSGKRILLLERGDWLPREPQNWRSEDVFVENRYVSPHIWYDADGKPFQPQYSSCRRATSIRTASPTAPPRSVATSCSTTASRYWRCRTRRTQPSFRRPWESTTSTSEATTSSTRSATSRWSASPRPRCSGARSRGRRSWRRSGRSNGSPVTRSTSGSRPRTLPSPDNRASVDRDGRLTLSYTETNATAKKRLYHRLKSMLGHLGMHSDHMFTRHAYMKNDIPVAGCAHQAGTCRFGTDPASSVLDVNCKAHELDNLYVVDTSIFPSIGAVNPALTAMANALRVSDHLLDRMGVPAIQREIAGDG